MWLSTRVEYRLLETYLWTMVGLDPPFLPEDSLVAAAQSEVSTSGSLNTPGPSSSIPLVFPAGYHHGNRFFPLQSDRSDELGRYLARSLDVSRLNRIHKHLWFAGLERPARALHRCISAGREITLTEQADQHLLWITPKVFLKPLPMFLLCHAIWEEHLRHDQIAYESGVWFLLSYMWLVCN